MLFFFFFDFFEVLTYSSGGSAAKLDKIAQFLQDLISSAVVDLPVSTLSRQSRIFDCRHTIPTVSTIIQL